MLNVLKKIGAGVLFIIALPLLVALGLMYGFLRLNVREDRDGDTTSGTQG